MQSITNSRMLHLQARLNGWSVVCSILDDGGNLVYLVS